MKRDNALIYLEITYHKLLYQLPISEKLILQYCRHKRFLVLRTTK
ncbi:hypothetical protein SAMN05443429_101306 [Cruoricaptor ignavus]|uniref:Uncharacterized protein n=1 Tax=Cruoricaptor ignavus TaxID=1118202 RepID=A0A1M6AIT2_9FLAO|nr:hypothetical protein SAMN05443429_101306 [Cruoricaptor ignavus]